MMFRVISKLAVRDTCFILVSLKAVFTLLNFRFSSSSFTKDLTMRTPAMFSWVVRFRAALFALITVKFSRAFFLNINTARINMGVSISGIITKEMSMDAIRTIVVMSMKTESPK